MAITYKVVLKHADGREETRMHEADSVYSTNAELTLDGQRWVVDEFEVVEGTDYWATLVCVPA